MENLEIIHVEKSDNDGRLIMEWRNDNITRKMSFNQNSFIWDKFKNIFFNKYFDNYIPPLFICYNNKKIAFIGFISNCITDNETSEKIVKISINLDPNYRGKHLGKFILNKIINYVKDNYILTKLIIAEIKEINIASYKLFESCNFKYIKDKSIKNEKVFVYHLDL